MRQVVITVEGEPAPQGSKRGIIHNKTGKVVLIEQSKKVKPWRQDVKQAVKNSGEPPFEDGPLEVSLIFFLTRPAGHYGTGRNAGIVKPSAPEFPAVRPDLDKFVRATLDGLSGLIPDDSRVVSLRAKKRYAGLAGERCDIIIREAVA